MSLEALSNALDEINELNSMYVKLEDALDKHAYWMGRYVRAFLPETALVYIPKFRGTILKINKIVEGLIPKDGSLFLLRLPSDRCSTSILTLSQKSLGELYKEDYKSIVGQSAKLGDLLKVKYTNQKELEENRNNYIKKYCYISLVCWFVLGICFYNPSRL